MCDISKHIGTIIDQISHSGRFCPPFLTPQTFFYKLQTVFMFIKFYIICIFYSVYSLILISNNTPFQSITLHHTKASHNFQYGKRYPGGHIIYKFDNFLGHHYFCLSCPQVEKKCIQ